VESLVYATADEIPPLLERACGCDLVVKHSGVGVFDEQLEEGVLKCRSSSTLVAFWDVDAPATLARVENDPRDPFRRKIPQFDLIFTYGGGPPVVENYTRLGAATCHTVYNALDPDIHHPVKRDPDWQCDLLFVGHRLPDRERRVEEFFFRAARVAPEFRFALGGEGWADKALPANVRRIGHVATQDLNRLNCSARMVLNVNRDSMASVGFSPPTRIFEAAGAGACVISDRWKGIEDFFAPGREILTAGGAEEVVGHLRACRTEAAAIGGRMRQRALREHTYRLRAQLFDSIVAQAGKEAASARLPIGMAL
jgi:spore maturation protein CgeB